MKKFIVRTMVFFTLFLGAAYGLIFPLAFLGGVDGNGTIQAAEKAVLAVYQKEDYIIFFIVFMITSAILSWITFRKKELLGEMSRAAIEALEDNLIFFKEKCVCLEEELKEEKNLRADALRKVNAKNIYLMELEENQTEEIKKSKVKREKLEKEKRLLKKEIQGRKRREEIFMAALKKLSEKWAELIQVATQRVATIFFKKIKS